MVGLLATTQSGTSNLELGSLILELVASPTIVSKLAQDFRSILPVITGWGARPIPAATVVASVISTITAVPAIISAPVISSIVITSVVSPDSLVNTTCTLTPHRSSWRLSRRSSLRSSRLSSRRAGLTLLF